MMNKRLYVDIHVLQTVPPSCVNRDDTGSPKTAVYGGTTRARVSSQAWKRAVRRMFMERMAEGSVGIRTQYIHDYVVKAIQQYDAEVDADSLAQEVLKKAGIIVKKTKKKAMVPFLETDILLFISPAQIDALARLAISGNITEDKACQALVEHPTIDMALFGRMVAVKESKVSLDIDAACQVAHAISTHTIHNEYDYFTAVDDHPAAGSASAYLDTKEFNSSTLYRYATVCVNDLASTLGGDTAESVKAFVDAFVMSMPTGSKSGYANGTPTDFVYVTIRDDQPVNLVGAFEKPVVAGTEGYVQHSVDALVTYAGKVYASFADAPAAAWITANADVADDFAQRLPRRAMLDALAAEIARRLADEVM